MMVYNLLLLSTEKKRAKVKTRNEHYFTAEIY